MLRIIFIFVLISASAFAGLPPTTSNVTGDSSNVVTFNYLFPNFTGTHSGVSLSLGVNSIAGGGTGQTTAANAINALLPTQTGLSGYVLGTNGTSAAWTSAGAGPRSQGTLTAFTTSGTFTTPANSSTSTIYQYFAVGGGGGAGGCNGSLASTGGGGAGGTAIGTFTGVSASTGITITINSGGGGGSTSGGSGTAGGSVVIGSPVSVTASGGSATGGSTTAVAGYSNAGGAGSGCSGSPAVCATGGHGMPSACVATFILSGHGGSSLAGAGGWPSGSYIGAPGAGTGYGAGGGGCSGTSQAGGSGSSGIVIITQLTP